MTKAKPDPLSKEAIAEMVGQPPASLDDIERLLFPLIQYFDPHYHQTENVRAGEPTMFVANHSIWSIADLLLPYGVKKHLDRHVRPLGDRMHYSPLAPQRKIFEKLGVVVGDRKVVRALMADRQDILVFPGGAREVMKRRDEKYTLQWKKRIGFLQLALEGGYSITPVGVSGGDDIFDILLDAGDILKTPLGKFLSTNELAKKVLRGGEELPQLVRGLGFSMLPRPQQFHFVFGEPMKLDAYRERIDDEAAMLEARGAVAEALLALIDTAHGHREKGMQGASWIRQFAANL